MSYSQSDIASIRAIMARAGCPATFDETDPDDIDASLGECIEKIEDSDPKLAEEMRKLQDEAGVRFDRGGRRTRKIGHLRKGKLTDLGYHPSRKTTSRHRALSKAVKKYGRLSTLRKVNAVAVLTKRRAPLTSRKYRSDVKYLQKKYF